MCGYSGLYSNVAKKSPPSIVLKRTDDTVNFNSTETQNKIQTALKKVNVTSTKVTRQGNLIVNVPNQENYDEATRNLKNVFNESIECSNICKVPPKLTIVGLPADYDQANFCKDIGEKDEILKEMVSKENCVEIVGCWEVKNETDRVVSKKLAVKVTPEIRNRLVIRNQGYVYMDLARYRVYDRLMVTQCFLCYQYNHIAKFCPNKTNSPTCGRCAMSHDTKNCNSSTEKCVNCSKASKPSNHCAFSYMCPLYELERKNLAARTDYESKN